MAKDTRITKRRVTMRNAVYVGQDNKGKPAFELHEAIDYVRPDFLDAYVADARLRWQDVEVSEEPDAGPGGYEGETTVPAHLAVADAGVTYAAIPTEG